MGTYLGTNRADTITPGLVTPGVRRDPFGSAPGDGDDFIRGRGGNDLIEGGGGSDRLYGDDGNDTIISDFLDRSDSQWDYVNAGAGNDIIYARGFGTFLGGSGHDRFFLNPELMGSGRTTLIGGTGSDWLDLSRTHVVESVDLRNGTTSVETVRLSGIENVVGTWLGNRIDGSDSFNWIDGGRGDDRIFGHGGDDILLGGDDDDHIYGGTGDDGILGGNGNDRIQGGSGSDYIAGGDGNDVLFGYAPGARGGGVDNVLGQGGNDILISSGSGTFDGGAGDDTVIFTYPFNWSDEQTLIGGADQDTLSMVGAIGHNVVNLASGYSNITGLTFEGFENLRIGEYLNSGDNRLYGTGGDNVITSGGGDDLIYGFTGDDDLSGGRGHDTLRGGQGDDTLNGGQGFDWLLGGPGADILTGGDGIDRFDFNSVQESSGASTDTILDFQAPGDNYTDTIDLSTIDADTTIAGNQAFVFHGVLTDAQGQARGPGSLWLKDTGINTYVVASVDGGNNNDLSIRITDNETWAASDYTAEDFYL